MAAAVLITGANRGLGFEFARQYATGGWRVFTACRNPATASELRRLAQDRRGRLNVVAMDVTDAGSVKNAATQLKDVAIDVLINSAGIAGVPGQKTGNVDYESWAQVLNMNTMGPLRVLESFTDHIAGNRLRRFRSGSSSSDEDGAETGAPTCLSIPCIPNLPCKKGSRMRPPIRKPWIPKPETLLCRRSGGRAAGWTQSSPARRRRSDELATSEALAERHVRFLMPLAFLSPRIVGAIADGTAQTGLTVSGLARSLPHKWIEQERMFGLS
jgi:short chain dehydrogenase